MKISILGLGGISQKYYLPFLSARPDIELQIYARTEDTVEQTQSIWKVSNTARNMDDILSWKPDAAFVLAPSITHYDLVSTLLKSDIDVFVEKPATLYASQTRELAEIADAGQRILMVGFNRRYAPLHQRAKEYWGNRKVEQAIFTKLRVKPFHDDVRGHLYDDTIHLVDTLRYYCGEGKVIHTEIRADKQFTGATALISLDGGGIAQVITSMRAGRWREQYLLAGDGLTMEVDAFRQLKISQGDEQRIWSEDYDSGKDTTTGRGFRAEIQHFLDCVATHEQPFTTGWDSIKTQEMVEAIAGK